MGDQQAPIGEVFYIEGASSYKYGSVPLIGLVKILFVCTLNDISTVSHCHSFLQEKLGDIVYVQLPEVGDSFEQDGEYNSDRIHCFPE